MSPPPAQHSKYSLPLHLESSALAQALVDGGQHLTGIVHLADAELVVGQHVEGLAEIVGVNNGPGEAAGESSHLTSKVESTAVQVVHRGPCGHQVDSGGSLG